MSAVACMGITSSSLRQQLTSQPGHLSHGEPLADMHSACFLSLLASTAHHACGTLSKDMQAPPCQ
jgi:hypothetical protein